METDHIVPQAEGGPDTIDNAIPLCFECHAEVHAYNDKHPRGRKFTADELRLHKEQWLRICAENPNALLPGPGAADADIGPIQALIDELEYNLVVARRSGDPRAPNGRAAAFQDTQFRRAIQTGAIALMPAELREAIQIAYAGTDRANKLVATELQEHVAHWGAGNMAKYAQESVQSAEPLIRIARDSLVSFLKFD